MVVFIDFVGGGDLEEGVEDGGWAGHAGEVRGGRRCVLLPVHKLDGGDEEVPVGPNAMPEDGRQAEAMVALAVVVVSERD